MNVVNSRHQGGVVIPCDEAPGNEPTSCNGRGSPSWTVWAGVGFEGRIFEICESNKNRRKLCVYVLFWLAEFNQPVLSLDIRCTRADGHPHELSAAAEVSIGCARFLSKTSNKSYDVSGVAA